jgi:hypothetical protein
VESCQSDRAGKLQFAANFFDGTVAQENFDLHFAD